ncbi:hypothetical protein Tco_0731218 [Tanacetum coccineum]
MIDCLSIVEIDKVIHTVESNIVKHVVEIEGFGMSSDEFDKETGSSDVLQPKQADLSCVHALNALHLHEICVVPSVDWTVAEESSPKANGPIVAARVNNDDLVNLSLHESCLIPTNHPQRRRIFFEVKEFLKASFQPEDFGDEKDMVDG